MVSILSLAHLSLFAFSLLRDRRRGLSRLRNLSIPVGIGFLYISVVQGRASAANPGRELALADVEQAMLVSLSLYAVFLLCYFLVPGVGAHSLYKDSSVDIRRLNAFGFLFYFAGLAGYFMSIRIVGGVRAYLRLEEATSYLYDASGYIYMLKFAVYAAVALWLLSFSLNGLSKWLHAILVISMGALLLEALQATDRGDTIRASLPIIVWLYFLSGKRSLRQTSKLWVYAATALILAYVVAAVLLLPEFRGNNRSFFTSDVTVAEAVSRVASNKGTSRLSEEGGGEFDSAARIIKRVDSGVIEQPGPVHIARLLWNIVPRALVPLKWDLFNHWAGPQWQEILIGASSYYGCTITGWGEAYGCLGWLGALMQWAILGLLVKKYEGLFAISKAGLMISGISYLPLINYVVMTFHAATMTLCTVVVPVLVVLALCQSTSSKVGSRLEHSARSKTKRRRSNLAAPV